MTSSPSWDLDPGGIPLDAPSSLPLYPVAKPRFLVVSDADQSTPEVATLNGRPATILAFARGGAGLTHRALGGSTLCL